MRKFKSIMGYTWAILAFIIALATFLSSNSLSRGLASATGVTVSPLYSGGEIVKTIEHGAYKASIHRPVFDSLIGQTKEGFIQINWDPSAGLPPEIRESIDYNGDGKEDFVIILNPATGEAKLTAVSLAVLSVDRAYRLRNGWAVRVRLLR
jgi:hypothetical protein